MDRTTQIDDEDSSSQPTRLLMRGRGLCKTFGGQTVLGGVDFDLYEGEVVLLRGANGSGKTTLLNMLTGNLAPDDGKITLKINGNEEHFKFPRRWWQNLNPADHFLPERVAREGVGRSWQDTRLFRSIQLIENITAATEKHPGENPWNVLFRPQVVEKAEQAARNQSLGRLGTLGLQDRESSFGDKVSLGQSKRVAIARAIAGGAKVLFLDEPLSGVDVPGIQSVVEMLRELVREHRVTLVIIEHVWNVQHVASLATTVWELEGGTLISKTNKEMQRMNVSPVGFSKQSLSGMFSHFTMTCSRELPRGARLDVYRKSNPPEDLAGIKELADTQHEKNEISQSVSWLKVTDLEVKRGNRLVIDGLSFELYAGDLAVLQAPNGWGKTTLMDALAGLQQIEKGQVSLNGNAAEKWPSWKRVAGNMMYIRSNNTGFLSLSTREINRLRNLKDKSTDECLYGQLSGGEKQNFLLNQLDSTKNAVCLLDEPFSALDNTRVKNVVRQISQITDRHGTVLVALPTLEGRKKMEIKPHNQDQENICL